MRQRITYLLSLGTGIDPSNIVFDKTELEYRSTDDGAHERRVTIGLSDLPEEIQSPVENLHELHLRIVSGQNYHAFSPANSRLPPGLHAFITPKNSSSKTNLCRAVKHFLGGSKCESDEESFIKPSVSSKRFARSSTFQYYQGPLDYHSLVSGVNSYLCSFSPQDRIVSLLCDLTSAANSADHAAYIDVDFDVISHTITVTTFWDKLHPKISPKEGRYRVSRSTRLEVGVLQEEVAREREQLSLGGYLTIVGEDDHPSQTLFSFPSRHHPLPASDKTSFTASFQQPTGLHPKLELTFPRALLAPPQPTCSLHAYWTLPSTLFIDRYQLSDQLFLSSQNLASLRSLDGEQDLEAPEWTVKAWGSAALLELALPPAPPAARNTAPSLEDKWTVTIPTHLRYVNALGRGGKHADVAVPWPVVFWACDAEEGLKFPTNPFDRTNLGYDGLFGPRTMFYHVPPGKALGGDLVETVRVPVVDEGKMTQVPVGTMVAVVLGFAWVCWQMLRGVRRTDVKGKKE